MVDRFITKLTDEKYEFVFDNVDEVTDILNNGCILIQSHYGGWAASSNSAHITKKINIVMQETMLDSIKSIENLKDSNDNLHIIDLNKGMIAVSIEIAHALSGGEIVAIMADRSANQKANQKVMFFDKEANFNKNPFQIAYKCNKPILVYFVVLDGIKKYKVEYKKILVDKSLKEKEAITKAMNEYVKMYEKIVTNSPSQWFNFYNFWEN
jgi:predicted LPLAT superfamily acyltransferase